MADQAWFSVLWNLGLGAILTCVNTQTGKVAWKKRTRGNGTLLVTDDRLLILSERGRLILAKATPEQFEEICSFQALTGKCWTAPTVSGSLVFVRNLEKMVCYDLGD